MQTIFLLLLLFLITIFSILLYLNSKNSRLQKLLDGECPRCKDKKRVFFDAKTKTSFEHHIIKSRLLKNHGCSGANEIEFTCQQCGLLEVHTLNNQSSCGV